MKSKLTSYIRAGYACLYAVSHEEERITKEIIGVAEDLKHNLWSWALTTGLECSDGNKLPNTNDPLKALTAFIEKTEEKSIVILKDFHLFLKGNPPAILIRTMKEVIIAGRASNRHFIILGCQLHLPPELEKEITVIEFSLPTREELNEVLEDIAKAAKVEINGNRELLLDAGSGLTSTEFADALAYSKVECGDLYHKAVSKIKAGVLKKGGILEVVEPGVTFDDLGGLGELKAWVSKRKQAFSKKAREYGLPIPKGVCIYGAQGAGKSYATRAIASELGCPLLRLDAGKLFGGLVGSSEANVRAVIAQVEAFGKCILQIDEIDKGFAGMTSSHDGDSGTTRRVIGTFLTWMQDKTSPVFIVATANDLTKLPPELLRKGRWDELFFIDLPNLDERVEIWRVQIRKHGRKPDKFDLTKLAVKTDGWTGAEIEALFNEGLYAGFQNDSEPDTQTLELLSYATVPLSKTMSEPIKALREWSIGRARSASSPITTKKASTARKIA